MNTIIQVLKGGRGSGDWGHTGRPGKRGGSGGGGGKGKPRKGKRSERIKKAKEFLNDTLAFKSDAEPFMDRFGPDAILAMKGYGGFSFGGLTSKIDMTSETIKGVFFVEGTILNESGNIVGRFSRELKKNPDDTLIVDHIAFDLKRSEQGKGFGSSYYQHSENELIKGGVNKLTLHANVSVGGYAWARMGFDFASGRLPSDIVNDMTERWKSDYGRRVSVPNFGDMKPWEIASLKGPDGNRIGKEMLLGSGWDGVKDLTEGSESRKVGDAYYASKGR